MNEMHQLRLFFVTNRFEPSLGGIERQSKLLALALRNRGIGVTVLTDRYIWSLPGFEIIDGIAVRRLWSLWTIRRPFERVVKAILIGRTESVSKNSLEGNTPPHRYSHQSLRRRMLRLFSYRLPMYTLCLSVFAALVWRRREYDIVQVFQANLLAFAATLAGRITGKPVITVDASSGGMEELTEFLLPRTTSSWIKDKCTFIAISRHIEKDLLARGISSSRIQLIPNSVDIRPLSADVEQNVDSVLFVGNVYGDVRQKGLDILLRAWKQIAAEVPDSRLTIIGVGDFSSFQALANEEKVGASVEFAGLQNNVGPWYEKCAIFVLPSRYEGMPTVLLEAMSYAKPCVATSVSGSDDLIEDGKNGLKVPVEDPDALARAIVFLMKNPGKAREFGRNARMTVEARHSPEKIAGQYLSVYHNIRRSEGADSTLTETKR
jgi:glycosyltransferase involved in cell wall biosynthesis